MTKDLRFIPIAVLLVLVSAAAHAKDDFRGRWWHVPGVGQKMQLGETEIRQLDEAFEAARLRMVELKAQLEAEQGKLRILMEQSEFNEAAIKEQHRRQESARTQLADVRFAFLLEARKIIGHDRFMQLLDIRAERRKGRHAKMK